MHKDVTSTNVIDMTLTMNISNPGLSASQPNVEIETDSSKTLEHHVNAEVEVVNGVKPKSVKCIYCDKICGNAGNLKVHVRSKHKDFETSNKTVESETDPSKTSENSVNTTEAANGAKPMSVKCNYCDKICGNAGSLKVHEKSKHKDLEDIHGSAEVALEPTPAAIDTVVTSSKFRGSVRGQVNIVGKTSRRRSVSKHKSKASDKK